MSNSQDHSRTFRHHLARRLVMACIAITPVAMACGSDVTGGDGGAGGMAGSGGAGGDNSSVTTGQPAAVTGGGGWQETVCIGWPPTNGTGGAGGGSGGAGGQAAGVGGAGGEAPCPTDPTPYFDNVIGCESVLGPSATQGPDECCYEVLFECGTGRPYTADGKAVSAPAIWGSLSAGWDSTTMPEVSGLSGAEREALAKAWCQDGMYEHASVASFGRFAMELMAVGAPSELIEAAHRAAMDEIRHAKACLSLASAYADKTVRPGDFPFGGHSEVSGDLAEIAARAAFEGCVGETVASIQATEQLATATDPAVRTVLEAIAKEEAAHAELAWRTVSWAITQGGEPVRQSVARAIDAAIKSTLAPAAASTPVTPAMTKHGRLSNERLCQLRRRAVEDVVIPCADRLLGLTIQKVAPAHQDLDARPNA